MQRIINTLVEEGYSITWISRSHNQKYSNCQIKQSTIETFFNSGVLFYLEFNIRLFFKFFKHVDKLISNVDLDTILATRLYCLIKRKHFIFDAHEYFSEVPELSGKDFKKKIWKYVGRLCIPYSLQRYTVGDSLAEALTTDYNSAFKVIRNVAAYSVGEKLMPDSSSFKIVYLGVLNEGRGLEQLIDSLNFLPQKYHLVLIGEGDLSSRLRSMVNVDEGLKSRVEFAGMVKPEDIPSFLSQARIAANLLVNSSKSYYLSLANKYFDYVHAQIPTVGMQFPEYQQLNNDFETSVLIDELSPVKISQAILQLENETFYQKLKSNCFSASQVLNWETEKHKLLDIYRGVFATV